MPRLVSVEEIRDYIQNNYDEILEQSDYAPVAFSVPDGPELDSSLSNVRDVVVLDLNMDEVYIDEKGFLHISGTCRLLIHLECCDLEECEIGDFRYSLLVDEEKIM